MLPSKFAIVFDGWSLHDTHIAAIFVTFPSDKKNSYSLVLLSFSPIEDETSQDAASHLDYLNWGLDLYEKSLSNVTVVIGDNCTTNLLFTTIADTHFVGCTSHCFNLAVQDIHSEWSNCIKKVHDLMKKLRIPIRAVKLRKNILESKGL